MKVFDTHTHCFADALAPRAMSVLTQKAFLQHYHDGTFSGLCDYERRIGSSGCLVLPIATKPSQARAINEWAATLASDDLRVVAFGSVHPDSTEIASELDRLQDLGLKGIKLHPEYQSFYPDEDKLWPLYDELFKRGLILYFHAGEDLGFEPPARATADRLAKVADRYPEAKIITAHMGGFRCWAEVRKYLAGHRNIWMDTSFGVCHMTPEDFTSLCRLHGTDRVMYGTDSPWTDGISVREAVMAAPLTHNEKEDILYNNAARLLGL